MNQHLPTRHLLLALAVVAVWGTNFVVMKAALGHVPPLLLAALRFSFALVPGLFLLPRPQIAWPNLAAYGLLAGAQFALVYVAVNGRISPGLASLVVQAQVFFTIGLAMHFAHEPVRGYQWLALLLAAAGIGVIVSHTDGSTTVAGLALILLAALSWGGANIASKRAGKTHMLAYVVWSSAFAVPPLFALSLVFEGPAAIQASLLGAGPGIWGAILWQAWGNTLFGYAAWGWLLARYPAATISPLALLVPVFGMGVSALWLAEAMPTWKLFAAVLVMSGLALNLLWPRWRLALA